MNRAPRFLGLGLFGIGIAATCRLPAGLSFLGVIIILLGAFLYTLFEEPRP